MIRFYEICVCFVVKNLFESKGKKCSEKFEENIVMDYYRCVCRLVNDNAKFSLIKLTKIIFLCHLLPSPLTVISNTGSIFMLNEYLITYDKHLTLIRY